jgi:hypothetical protein
MKGAMPVGSVEFMAKCFDIMGLTIEPINPYPRGLPYGRDIYQSPIYAVFPLINENNPMFIKPIQLKQFNGFVFRGVGYQDYDEHDKEQIYKFLKMRLNDCVYTSEVVNFLAEWRMYYINGVCEGTVRYDPNNEDYDDPVINIDIQGTKAVDVGLLPNGSYVVVEVNDAWAIGLYKGLPAEKYYQFLITRWKELCSN